MAALEGRSSYSKDPGKQEEEEEEEDLVELCVDDASGVAEATVHDVDDDEMDYSGDKQQGVHSEDNANLEAVMRRTAHGCDKRQKTTSRRKQKTDEGVSTSSGASALWTKAAPPRSSSIRMKTVAGMDFAPSSMSMASSSSSSAASSTEKIVLPFAIEDDEEILTISEERSKKLHPNRDSVIYQIHQIHFGGDKKNSSAVGSSAAETSAIVSEMHERFEQGLRQLTDQKIIDEVGTSESFISEISRRMLAQPDVNIDAGQECRDSKADSDDDQDVPEARLLTQTAIRTRAEEDEMLREKMGGERDCVNGAECEGLFVCIESGFVLAEFPSVGALEEYRRTGRWPEDDHGECVLCSRRRIMSEWVQVCARAGSDAASVEVRGFDEKKRKMARYLTEMVVPYQNLVEDGEYDLYSVLLTAQNSVTSKGGESGINIGGCLCQDDTPAISEAAAGFSGWADAAGIFLSGRFLSLTSYGVLSGYNKMFERPYTRNIREHETFVPENNIKYVGKASFQSAQEWKRSNDLYLGAFNYAPATRFPIRPERGFLKMKPYVSRYEGPYGDSPTSAVKPREAFSKNSISTFQDIWRLSHEIPQVALVRGLARVGWTTERIDAMVPQWLYDRRLDHETGTHQVKEIFERKRRFSLACPWMPLKITESMVEEQRHVRYCAMVLRIYQLERIKIELQDGATTHASKSRCTEECLMTNRCISEAMKWQETMVLTAMFMDFTGVYDDAQLEELFHREDDSHLGTYDTGLHAVMHEGELPDVSDLVVHLPFRFPVEKRSQKQRRIRGRSTDAGSIGDMRGTPFDGDTFACALMTIMVHGMSQPNKIRSTELLITNLLYSLRGKIELDESSSASSSSSSSGGQSSAATPSSCRSVTKRSEELLKTGLIMISSSDEDVKDSDEDDEEILHGIGISLNDELKATSGRRAREEKRSVKRRTTYTPKWSSLKQKKVASGTLSTRNPGGGHNAHRLLDVLLRMVGASFLGRYPGSGSHPSVNTVFEIYRLIQFDFPRIDDVCTWLRTPLPMDMCNYNKTREKKGEGGTVDWTDKAIKDGSSTRRYLITYILREHHIYSVRQMPAIWESLRDMYEWDMIVENITETMDALRTLVDESIGDARKHSETCLANGRSFAGCKHCDRWRIVTKTHHPNLVRLYERWPVLFAIDRAAQWKKSSVDYAVPNQALSTASTTRIFAEIFVHSQQKAKDGTYAQMRHRELLALCWRPPMRSFSQNAVGRLKEVDATFSSASKAFACFSSKKRRTSSKDIREKIHDLSRQTVDEYNAYAADYMQNIYPNAKLVMNTVISKFSPGEPIGLMWMVPMLGLHVSSVLAVMDSKQRFDSEKARKNAYKSFLGILAEHPKDYFLLRTWYGLYASHSRIRLFDLDHRLMRKQIDAVAKKVGPEIAPSDRPLPRHLTRFWVCTLHGKVNAALVGTELGEEGEKNCKSFGNSGIAVNPVDGNVYCTISGKRMERRHHQDVCWACLLKPNVSIDFLAKVVQLYDTLYVLCPHCGNPMVYRLERVACGRAIMWCGQCPGGRREMATWLGYKWYNETSISPCAFPVSIGGIKVLNEDGCVFCTNSHTSCEAMDYQLVWDDVSHDGSADFAYIPVCGAHQRTYHAENWDCMRLRKLTFLIQNCLRSRIVGFGEESLGPATSKSVSEKEDYRPRSSIRMTKDYEKKFVSRLRSTSQTPVRIFYRPTRRHVTMYTPMRAMPPDAREMHRMEKDKKLLAAYWDQSDEVDSLRMKAMAQLRRRKKRIRKIPKKSISDTLFCRSTIKKIRDLSKTKAPTH